jgi:hypothetical protein
MGSTNPHGQLQLTVPWLDTFVVASYPVLGITNQCTWGALPADNIDLTLPITDLGCLATSR